MSVIVSPGDTAARRLRRAKWNGFAALLPLLHRGRCRSIATVDKALILKYSLYLANKFLCTLTHNSPRCSLLRNGAQTDRRNASSPLCFPWRSLPSPSRPKPRLSAQLTHQHREGPRPFSGLIGQHAHGWRQLELPPLNHQLLAAFAAQPIRAVHEAAMQQIGSTGRRHHSHNRPATRSASPRTAQHLQDRARRSLQRTG